MSKLGLLGSTAALFVAGAIVASTSASANDAAVKADAKGECHGMNACKGKGACGGEGHGCAGKNACKGKGWVSLTEKDCTDQKGTFTADSAKKHQDTSKDAAPAKK